MDNLRILKALANSLISSKFTPSTKLPVDWLMVGWSVREGWQGIGVHVKTCDRSKGLEPLEEMQIKVGMARS